MPKFQHDYLEWYYQPVSGMNLNYWLGLLLVVIVIVGELIFYVSTF